ncbi:MAG: site-2 protease family protein [Patescibacteria group bacterium]|jgi:Zn-dependent protease
MFLTLLSASPIIALAWAVALIVSLTVHEFSHALVGKWRGDTTAEDMGRLTLNPLAHLDIFGTLMLLVVGFGWAKPVPFDPRRLANPLFDGAVIAMAGPFANMVMAVLAGVAFRELGKAGMLATTSALPAFLIFVVLVNMLLLFFNLIPVPPLDGSKVLDAGLEQAGAYKARVLLEQYGPRILLVLVVLSLVSPLNVFVVVQAPATFACDQLSGVSCLGLLGTYIGL